MNVTFTYAHNMPPLHKKWFKETGDLPVDLASKLVTNSFGQAVVHTLTYLEWDGRFTACVGVELTPDNRHIRRSEFMLRGIPSKDPVQLRANNLWSTAGPDVLLTLTIPDGSAFHFSNGTLASDYIAGEDVRHHFTKDGDIITPTEWPAYGIGEIAVRAVCHLDKSSNVRGPCIKVTFLIMPHSYDEISGLGPHTLNPAWPGLRVLDTTCNLFPQHPSWKDPCCPLILLGSDYNLAPNLPEGREIRYHIAAVMKTAKRPTICNKQRSLAAKWAAAIRNVEELELDPLITWPAVPRHQPTTGEYLPFYNLVYCSNLSA